MISETVKGLYDRQIAVEVRRIHGANVMVGSWVPNLLVFKNGALYQLVDVNIYSQDRGVFKDTILIPIPALATNVPDQGFMIEEG